MDAGRFVGAVLFLGFVSWTAPLGAQPRGPETTPAQAPETRASQAVPSQQPVKAVKTSLEMKVQGVLAIGEGDDRRSSAIIAIKGKGRAYSPGQMIDDNPDLKLVKIQDERIEFYNRGQLEFAPVKRFPDAGPSVGGSAPSSYSPPDNKVADNQPAPARTPFRRPKPARRPGSTDDAIAPAAADGQDADGQ